MLDVIQNFQEIPIDGSRVLEIKFDPLKRLYLSFFTFQSLRDKGGHQYDLLFRKIAACEFDLSDISENKIIDHKVFSNSKLLHSWESMPKSAAKFNKEKLRHYQLTFETGTMNIIAEEYSCHLVWQT